MGVTSAPYRVTAELPHVSGVWWPTARTKWRRTAAENILALAAKHGTVELLCKDRDTLREVRSAVRYVALQNGPSATVRTDGLTLRVRLRRD